MKDTPRTDELVQSLSYSAPGCGHTVRYWHPGAAKALVAHAKQLERELAEAKRSHTNLLGEGRK